MAANNHYNRDNMEKEETLLLERLIALQKQLDEDEVALQKNKCHSKENIMNTNVITSKFKYRKVNNFKINAFVPTKINGTNLSNNQHAMKTKELSTQQNKSTNELFAQKKHMSNIYVKPNLGNMTSTKTVADKNQFCLSDDVWKSLKDYSIEINKVIKASNLNSNKSTLLDNCHLFSNISQTLFNVDNYIKNANEHLDSFNYTLDKNTPTNVKTSEKTNCQSKNVHVNRKFQNKYCDNSSTVPENSLNLLQSVKKSVKKTVPKKLPGKLFSSPALVKIGKTKLIRQSLIKSKYKLNNQFSLDNRKCIRKQLGNTLLKSYNKTKWNKIINSTAATKSICMSSNKLKWTKPNKSLVNDFNRVESPKTDKLILFGKNKIIRQSIIGSVQSKTNKYKLKHLSHRFALMRKLQLKSNTKNKTILNYEQTVKNTLPLKNTNFETIKNKKNSHSMYSYVNPKLRSKINTPNSNASKIKSSSLKCQLTPTNASCKPRLSFNTENKDKNKFKLINNNKTLDQHRSIKRTLTKQLCLVFNRFGTCPLLNEGKCDKRHYKKFIMLCSKYLSAECVDKNCTLSHNIVKEKIPFCNYYLSGVCVQLNCQYIHEYRNPDTPICKKFLHGYCALGIKCPKKHLNLCPSFATKNKCPHGQKCLYPHVLNTTTSKDTAELNEPRYFETTIPKVTELNVAERYHIVPRRHAPLLELPSFIPLS
ncbi:uncharacterized protein LOC126840521 isoform X2 [Adelges cooleyi]|nr:uncharacterized protein LOC126840521 isoform X2 [Adelges cooleyi]XP_050432291.1 uncharacterized protein LOC126840521 isoform X2 [Adelges cooleyi]